MNFRQQKLALISIAVSLIEIAIIWGGVAIATVFPHHNWEWFGGIFHWTFKVGGLCSLAFAVLGLLIDKQRQLAWTALALAILNFGICAPPLTA